MLNRTAQGSWRAGLVCVALAACSGGDPSPDSSEDTESDTSGDPGGGGSAVVQISFPPPSATTAEGITVRGTGPAADQTDGAITEVSIAGIAAQSDDGFATWRANVPLSLGTNLLSVEFTAGGQRMSADSVAVERWASEQQGERGVGNWPGRMLGAGYDYRGGRAVVSDDIIDGLFAIDAATGDRSVISDSESSNEVGSGYEIVRPTDVTVGGDTAWVVDGGVLVSVDLATGDRAVLAEPGNIAGIAANREGTQLLLLSGGALQQVAPATGALTPLAGDGPSLDGAHAIAVDWATGRAVVLFQYRDDIGIVDLATGARQVLANDSGVKLTNPEHVAIAGDSTALIWSDGRAIRVDLDSGARAVLTGSGVALRGVQGMAASPLGVVIADYVPDWEDSPRSPMAIVIDAATGDRVVLAR